MPGADYPKKLAGAVAAVYRRGLQPNRRKRAWFIGAAAIIVLVFVTVLSSVLPMSGIILYMLWSRHTGRLRHIMGSLKLWKTNAKGEEFVQTQLEVWADKEGRYYTRVLEGLQKGVYKANNGERDAGSA
jgi:hypothetical protein